MENKDIHWVQRFSNYQKALNQLKEAVDLMETRDLSNLEKQGMIQVFEYTHELAWKTLNDFLKSRGNTEIYGSKDATREAFQLGLIEDGELWMKMIQSRNLTSHVYFLLASFISGSPVTNSALFNMAAPIAKASA